MHILQRDVSGKTAPYIVVPKSPNRSPKLMFRTPFATAFWNTPKYKQ